MIEKVVLFLIGIGLLTALLLIVPILPFLANMRYCFLLVVTLLSLLAVGFGPGFSPVAHMVSRPPQLWLDVKQLIETNAADRVPIHTSLIDYSGHGFRWGDNTSGRTNVQYFTRLTGCISTMGQNTEGLANFNTFSNTCHVQMLSGPGSEFLVQRGKHTNQCTIAIRVNYRTGNGEFAITGHQAGPVKYAYAQFSAGTLFWDFGEGTPFRVSKALPADFTGNWVNVFFTRGRTNQDIWMQGNGLALTNFVSGSGVCLGNDGTANSLTFNFGMSAITNWYWKRIIIWDYELPFADMQAWSRRMTELP